MSDKSFKRSGPWKKINFEPQTFLPCSFLNKPNEFSELVQEPRDSNLIMMNSSIFQSTNIAFTVPTNKMSMCTFVLVF